jgi:NhaA family Na+:H+ antiporter
MHEQDEQAALPESTDKGVYHSPWEKTFSKIITPFEEFVHRQTTTGLLLMGTTILALLLANSEFADAYQKIVKLYSSISVGDWELRLSLQHWVNDALMALFFFVVGLELKREFLVGELAQMRQAVLPIAAAIGGMVVPALFYTAFNLNGPGADGWGIPMATDIAFAIGVLVLMAGGVPAALITFLVALAIVDDLGAVMVIAVFYTADIVMLWLLVAAAILGLLVVLNLIGIRRTAPYFILAICLWYALFQSGIHATLAGILGAMTVPAKPKYDPELFSQHIKKLLENFDNSYKRNKNIMQNDELHGVVQTFENGVQSVQPPLLRLEHIWHTPVAWLVIPIFALFNAGIPLDFATLAEALSHPVALGIGFGLVFGKFVGITGASWLVLKFGIGQLPDGTSFRQIAGVSFLAGIGFTMAIFIAELGLAQDAQSLLMAKTSILFASLLSGLIGFVWLYLCSGDSAASKQTVDSR